MAPTLTLTTPERLQQVLDRATLGVWEIELSTRTLTCSAQCKANFGRAEDRPFTYSDLLEAIYLEDRAGVLDAVAAACDGDGVYEAEYRVQWPDGTTHWISARGAVGYVDGRPITLAGVTMDVTAHKAAAEAERAAREFSDRLIQSSVDCIKVLDLSGRIVWVSPAGLVLLAAPAHGLIGRSWTGFWTGDARRVVRDAIARASAGGTARFEARSRTFDGIDRWWDVSVAPVCGADGTPERLLAVSRDITERKNLEDALRRSCEDLEARVVRRTSELQALGERLENVREEERTRLARELHDELGQTLTALKLNTHLVRRGINGHRRMQDVVGSRLRDMESLLDETLIAIERIVTELRPAVLDELGFCAAAEWHVRQFATRSNIAATFTCAESLDVTGSTATALFRVLQEALTNVARHAHADSVAVTLSAGEDGVILEISDNGCGLPLAPSPGFTYGLRGMEERLRAVGGELALLAAPHRGTSVRARVPAREAAS